MKKESSSVRLKKIMSIRNLRQVDILNLTLPYCKKYGLKMNKSDISQYCSGKTEPNQKKLFVLGCALNVNEAWLMGFDVPMERTLSSEDPERLSLIPVIDKIHDEINEQEKRMDAFVQLFRLHGYKIEITKSTFEIAKNSKHCSLTQKEFASLLNRCYKDFEYNINRYMDEYESRMTEELEAAHERTDIEVTDKMKQHDDDIMDDDDF